MYGGAQRAVACACVSVDQPRRASGPHWPRECCSCGLPCVLLFETKALAEAEYVPARAAGVVPLCPECRRDYRADCPVVRDACVCVGCVASFPHVQGWLAARRGMCVAPHAYTGGCDRAMHSSRMHDAEKAVLEDKRALSCSGCCVCVAQCHVAGVACAGRAKHVRSMRGNRCAALHVLSCRCDLVARKRWVFECVRRARTMAQSCFSTVGVGASDVTCVALFAIMLPPRWRVVHGFLGLGAAACQSCVWSSPMSQMCLKVARRAWLRSCCCYSCACDWWRG